MAVLSDSADTSPKKTILPHESHLVVASNPRRFAFYTLQINRGEDAPRGIIMKGWIPSVQFKQRSNAW